VADTVVGKIVSLTKPYHGPVHLANDATATSEDCMVGLSYQHYPASVGVFVLLFIIFTPIVILAIIDSVIHWREKLHQGIPGMDLRNSGFDQSDSEGPNTPPKC